MRVLVTRDAGDVLAPDLIIEPLAITTVIGVERGKQYLYDEGFDKRIYEITIPYRQEIIPTDIISVLDSSLGEVFSARCLSHTITAQKEGNTWIAYSKLLIERCEI